MEKQGVGRFERDLVTYHPFNPSITRAYVIARKLSKDQGCVDEPSDEFL